MGMYGQYYVSPHWNLFIEFNPTVTGWRNQYNSIAAGVELETTIGGVGQFFSHNSAVEAEIEHDSVSGNTIGAAFLQGFEKRLPGQLRCQDRGQALALTSPLWTLGSMYRNSR